MSEGAINDGGEFQSTRPARDATRHRRSDVEEDVFQSTRPARDATGSPL